MFEFVRLEPRHIGQLAELEKICFASAWSEESFLSECQNPLAHYIVVLCGEKAVGYAGCWHIAGEGHITNIAVHPDYRRRALGSRLLENMQREAERCGVRLLTLEVRVSNAAAIALYKKFGFETVGARKHYYSDNGEDALIMTKEW